jgi:hypothetical protein
MGRVVERGRMMKAMSQGSRKGPSNKNLGPRASRQA